MRQLTRYCVIKLAWRSRRLKPDSKFNPLPAEENEEIFRNGFFHFNISKLLAFIQGHPEDFPIEQIQLNTLANYSAEHLNEETVQKADLAAPVLLAEISPGRFNVIDGNHRIERARRDKRSSLPGYRVGPETHARFLTSLKAYLAYIQYWNGKSED